MLKSRPPRTECHQQQGRYSIAPAGTVTLNPRAACSSGKPSASGASDANAAAGATL